MTTASLFPENLTTRELEMFLQHMIKNCFDRGIDTGTTMNNCSISLRLYAKNAKATVKKNGKAHTFTVAYTTIARNGFSADAEKIAKFINA